MTKKLYFWHTCIELQCYKSVGIVDIFNINYIYIYMYLLIKNVPNLTKLYIILLHYVWYNDDKICSPSIRALRSSVDATAEFSEGFRSVSQFLKRVISSVRRFISLCKSETINLIKSHRTFSLLRLLSLLCVIPTDRYVIQRNSNRTAISNAFTSTPPQKH